MRKMPGRHCRGSRTGKIKEEGKSDKSMNKSRNKNEKAERLRNLMPEERCMGSHVKETNQRNRFRFHETASSGLKLYTWMSCLRSSAFVLL